MDAACRGYSAAQALRSGVRAGARGAAGGARANAGLGRRTRARSGPGHAGAVPTGLNPPLWELGHIGWFQEYWLARNRGRELGAACDPAHARGASLLPGADACYDSAGWPRQPLEAAVAGCGGTPRYLADTLAQTLALVDALPADAGDADSTSSASWRCTRTCMPRPASTWRGRSAFRCGRAADAGRAAAGRRANACPDFQVGQQRPWLCLRQRTGAARGAHRPSKSTPAPVTWADFMGFVESGGYAQRRWWSDEGWAWLPAAGPPGALRSGRRHHRG